MTTSEELHQLHLQNIPAMLGFSDTLEEPTTDEPNPDPDAPDPEPEPDPEPDDDDGGDDSELP